MHCMKLFCVTNRRGRRQMKKPRDFTDKAEEILILILGFVSYGHIKEDVQLLS